MTDFGSKRAMLDLTPIVVDSPLDMHVHFRQGAMCKLVAPLTARSFAGALIMPNTNPIITPESFPRYRDEVRAAIGRDEVFTPYFTLFFQTDYTESRLKSVSEHITAIKFYPKGMTTNSDHGVDPADPSILPILKILESLQIPLCVHPEATGYFLRREKLFHQYIRTWATACPQLKIILEHISDRATIELLENYEHIYATITPHHLLFTTDDIIGDKLEPHNFCKPTPKEPEDLMSLRKLVFTTLGSPVGGKIMLGTDSAPHDVTTKECAHGCAGIFHAPIALQIMAEQFASYSLHTHFEMFVRENAKHIYGINPPAKKVTLVAREFTIPRFYSDDQGNRVVPMWAGQTLPWSIED